MLTYTEAIDRILQHSLRPKAKSLSLKDCLGLLVAGDLLAPEPFPGFDNSAVDGYAVSVGPDGAKEEEIRLKLRGEVPAGAYFRGRLKPGEAVQIFTGAPVPRGTQSVVMQENTQRVNGSVLLFKTPRLGENIRFRGEDFQRGRVLVRKGTVLGPTQLSLLAAVGYKKIPAYPPLKVALFCTGNELLRQGEKAKPGKIRDSNTILLEGLVKRAGAVPIILPCVGDQRQAIQRLIREGLGADVLLISGGVSVGKYDFVKEALRREGVKEIFWKVDIKPGKPLFFGKKGRTLVFGLPGNPVSVFVTFEEFVKPALLRTQGRKKLSEGWVEGRLTEGFKNGPRYHFIRVRCVSRKGGYAVTPLKGQGSHMIGSLASANALLRVEPYATLKRNQEVSVRWI
jgi:molybdopterin molybdotransferase